MPVNQRTGWGVVAGLLNTSRVDAGVESVERNVGVAIAVKAPPTNGVRLCRLEWRVDLAPNVAAGTVIAPDKYRLVVLQGELPQDITAYQNSAGYTNEPSIPTAIAGNSSLPVLHDQYLDANVSFPGLDILASESFADMGPVVPGNETLTILLTPIITALSQTAVGIAASFHYLAAWGRGEFDPSGGISSSPGSKNASLPRFDVGLPKG